MIVTRYPAMISAFGFLSILLALGNPAFSKLSPKEYDQHSKDQSNVLRYLGGTGPFVEATGYGIPTDVPFECSIDQAHLFMRHGERYPTKGTGKSLEELLTRLQNATVDAHIGPLAFVDDYDFFVHNTSWYEHETYTGAYAGSANAFKLGSLLRLRYNHLVNTSTITPVFTAGQERVYNTAKAFGQGFFFGGQAGEYKMVVLPETATQGANSLTNTEACVNFDGLYSDSILENVTLSYKEIEAARLNKLSPGLNITADDVYTMAGYCGFELDVAGTSKFCDALSMESLIGFGYDKDLSYYYSNGPGYNMSYVSGGVYANATATLLKQGPESAGTLFFSFSHDNDLLRYVTALGLYDHEEELSLDEIEFRRSFKSSEIVPMGGRLITERLSCYNTTSQKNDVYVRLILNDQIVPVPDCISGPSYSCPLEEFVDLIEGSVIDYPAACNLNSSYPQALTFYWDWKTNDYPTLPDST
ncbi:hypothetical protein KL918_003298 [Ogataea parapolymorpha]|nr:hypothetical protein KL918_003298 [Ogataea parapolymorpha]KAG7872467.1 hypothetical protein KL916_003202 [Ogataea parapolymorpha]